MRRVRVGETTLLRNLRMASLRDAPSAFERTEAEMLAKPESFWTEMEKSVTDPERHVAFVAEDGSRAIGLAFGIRRDDGTGHLGGMWVDPTARARGVGRALGEAVIEWARKAAFPHLALWVTENNVAARTLYERLGFVDTRLRDRHPHNPALLIAEMRLSL